VIGLASQGHHEWLAGHWAIPVACRHGVACRIRQAPGRADVFIDTVGADYMQLAPASGIQAHRMARSLAISENADAVTRILPHKSCGNLSGSAWDVTDRVVR
jgi:hypothetical protein